MIVHLDADAFFASVEQAADPKLRGKPVAVGGDRRGIIASASYEARKLGIYTPMPTARARKLCPRLIVLPGDFEKYERFSRFMFSYAYDFTPEVEVASIGRRSLHEHSYGDLWQTFQWNEFSGWFSMCRSAVLTRGPHEFDFVTSFTSFPS